MIAVNGLSKNFGAQVLFENVTLQLNPGQRYGLVGANGSGKSTFLRILTGDEPAGDGAITFAKHLRLGVLRQDQFVAQDVPILHVAMAGDGVVYPALQEQARLSDTESPDPARMVELEETISAGDGYTLEARTREILIGLGIPNDDLLEPLGTLSGGYRLRVLLASVLAGRPDALLLDEPTNHLDILSIRWLEQFLERYEGCAVVISHDRGFLDAISTRMLDVDYGTITEYPGNYSAFEQQKVAIAERKEAEIARAEKVIADKKAFVERFRAKATKARQAQSRLKQIEKIDVEERVVSSRQAPRFRFEQERPSGRDVLEVDGLGKAYGDNQVLEGLSFMVRRGERLAVIGENGIGKSTLLKILVGRLAPDAGKHEWGHAVKPGYFAQDHHELLGDPKVTPLNFVWDAVPAESTSYVRGQLGRMLLSGDEVDKSVTALSGGEAARVIFARLSVEKPNVLVLDEPTNHLDIETIDALIEALKGYEGTLIFVSHDRHFVSQLATRVLSITRQGVVDFPGTYPEYLAKEGDDHLSADAIALKEKARKKAAREAAVGEGDDPVGPEGPPGDAADDPAAGLSYADRKKLKNKLKALPKKRDELMESVESLEEQKARIQAKYAEPGVFDNVSELEKLQKQEADLTTAIDAAMAEWEAVEAEIAELEALNL